jgi:hypothetical protein
MTTHHLRGRTVVMEDIVILWVYDDIVDEARQDSDVRIRTGYLTRAKFLVSLQANTFFKLICEASLEYEKACCRNSGLTWRRDSRRNCCAVFQECASPNKRAQGVTRENCYSDRITHMHFNHWCER